MYAKEFREHKPRKVVIRMDPDCAICHAPASLACDCEARGLEVALRQAETRMMQSIYDDIRVWVREHARDYILEYFSLLKDRRLQAHEQHMERIRAQAFHYYHAQPHPTEVSNAQAAFKRGIDEDWQTSVQRYPEVLEYYYGLVELTLPADDDPLVRDPPLRALSGSRKAGRRGPATAAIANGAGSVGGVSGPPPNAGMVYGHAREALPRGRTPPPGAPSERMVPLERRTPVPRDRRSGFRQPPPPPPSSYYPPY